MKPAIVRLNINPRAGYEEQVRATLLTRLNAYESDGDRHGHDGSDAVQPILIRWVRSRFDLEVLVAVYDFASFDDLVMDVVRSIDGVFGTATHVMYDGFLFIGGIMMAHNARENGLPYAEAVIDISVEPGKDREVFAALYDLSEADDLHKYSLFKNFSAPEADMTLQVAGTNRETIEDYVQVFVRGIDGVVDTITTFTHGWAMLMDPEEFLQLQTQYSPL